MAKSPEEQLKDFIAKGPKSNYTFDSERDAPQSEICRELGKDSRDCIILQMHSKKLFEAMQDHGFFCALPLDPTRTYIECFPIPKS